MPWGSECCCEPGLSCHHRAEFVLLDRQRFLRRKRAGGLLDATCASGGPLGPRADRGRRRLLETAACKPPKGYFRPARLDKTRIQNLYANDVSAEALRAQDGLDVCVRVDLNQILRHSKVPRLRVNTSSSYALAVSCVVRKRTPRALAKTLMGLHLCFPRQQLGGIADTGEKGTT